MDQVPPHDLADVPDAPTTAPSPAGAPTMADNGLERASRILLKVGAVFVGALVLIPGVGLALLLLYMASRETLIEHQVTTEDRVLLLSLAAMVVGAAAACEGAVLRSLRQGWLALVVVGLGGITCMYICLRGIIAATGVDDSLVALSVAVGATGVVLVLGAALGIAGRLRGDRPSPRLTGHPS